MSFSNPQGFYLFLILIPFILIAVYNSKKKKKILNSFISNTAYKKLGVKSGKEISFFKTFLMVFSLIFFTLALTGPEWGERFENIDIKGIEMIILLDTSNSMNAEDLKPNRLEVAKQLIINIIDNLKTDYVSLVNFAGVAYVQCPLTIDYGAFKLLVEASTISPAEEQGTDFERGFSLSLKTFKASKSNKKILILITDGEDQERKWQESVSELKKNNIIVFTVGVGIISGAPIPLRDKEGKVTGWKKDKTGNIVKTRLDENTLIQIASKTGGQYFRLTDVSSIEIFIKNLQSFEKSLLRKKVKLKKIQRFHYPLIIGIICLIFELVLSEKKLKWKRG